MNRRDMLQEMIGKEPSELSPETYKLFEAIMKIVDDNDMLRKQIDDMDSEYQKLEKKYKELVNKYEKK